jgi:hypothetical protein
MHQPEVLERRDVAKVPHQWAHQLGVHSLKVVIGNRRHQRQRSLTAFLKRVRDISGSGRLSYYERSGHRSKYAITVSGTDENSSQSDCIPSMLTASVEVKRFSHRE